MLQGCSARCIAVGNTNPRAAAWPQPLCISMAGGRGCPLQRTVVFPQPSVLETCESNPADKPSGVSKRLHMVPFIFLFFLLIIALFHLPGEQKAL